MPETPRCGAQTRSGDPCKHPAGWGTDHTGEGRCKHHGGASPGGKPGNKNAVTTGEHESIYADTLTEDEVRIWNGLDTDQLAQLEEQIRLIAIRERRMMQRIQRIKREELTLTGWTEEEAVTASSGVGVPTEAEQAQHSHAIERIQKIEEALTRVQAEHRKLLREKYRMLKDQPADQSEKVDELLDRMAAMRTNTDEYHPPDMG
jgi:uncharacterized protein YjcR